MVDSLPKVSFLLLTYNQESYVAEAIRGAISQSYESLEIIISDDASEDGTLSKICAEVADYTGRHSIVVRKNLDNMGINAHFNRLFELASGEMIIVAAGDDISYEARVERVVKALKKGASCVFTNARLIDSQGNEKGSFVKPGYKHMRSWREMVIAGTHGTWGCTLAWDRKVFDLFGPMPTNILGEDAVIPFRCALMDGVEYIDEELVGYRYHGDNVSFWVREQGLSYAGLRRMGIKIMRFKSQMCMNWMRDLDVACSRGLIKEADREWGEAVLEENIQLFNDTKMLLMAPLWKMLLLFPVCFVVHTAAMLKHVSMAIAIKQTAWKLLNGVLHYRFPAVHQKIRTFLGRNT